MKKIIPLFIALFLISGCGNADLLGYAASEYCTTDPTYNKKTKVKTWPIDPAYAHLQDLGQFFTAHKCGSRRFGKTRLVEGQKFVQGSVIWLKDSASEELYTALKDVGYECKVGNERTCKKWRLEAEVDYKKILTLEPFVEEMAEDDCINCKRNQ